MGSLARPFENFLTTSEHIREPRARTNKSFSDSTFRLLAVASSIYNTRFSLVYLVASKNKDSFRWSTIG
jgi:hypothetical protein